MGIQRKLGLIFLIVSLIPVIFLGILVYDRSKKSLTQATFNNLNALATEQKARIADISRIYKERLVLVTAGSTLGASTKTFTQTGDPSAKAQIDSAISNSKAVISDIRDISISDLNGRVISSTTPENVGVDVGSEEFFQEGKGGILRPKVLKDSQGQLLLQIAGPVLSDNATVGVVMLTYPAQYLENLSNDFTGLGETGEFNVVERAPNGDALFITSLRFQKDSVLKERAPKHDMARPGNLALAGKEELHTNATDYRKEKVLTVTRYLPELDWGLLVKIDQDEAYRPIKELRTLLILFGGMFALLILILTVEITRAIARPLVRLSEVTGRISEGDFTKRVGIQSDDEIGRLGHSINHMAKRLQELRDNLEKTVEERTELLRAVTESASDAIISKDIHGRITSWNEGAVTMFGYSASEVIGKELTAILAKEHWSAHKKSVDDIRTMKKARVVGHTEQLEGVRKSGDRFPIELSLSKWSVRGNTYFTVIIRDVTERHQALLRANQLAAIVDASDDAVLSYDMSGKIINWNKGAEKMYRYSASEMIGNNVKLLLPPGHEKELVSQLNNIKSGASLEQFETQRMDRDKHIIHVAITVSPIRDSRGKVVAVSSISRDISKQQELMQRQRDFVSIASHELRTPLTALMGYLSMVVQKTASAEQSAQFVDRANAAARRLSLMVEDLLSVARIEDERITFAKAIVRPADIIGEHLASLQPSAKKKNIMMKFDNKLKDEDTIEVDQGKLDQVVINLIDNAIKYTPEGGRVAITAERQGKDVVISVVDTGIGIHPDNIDRIFDKFYREYTDLSVSAGGTGLGLFITKELVERQGGELNITSSHRQGTTATIRFPHVPPTK